MVQGSRLRAALLGVALLALAPALAAAAPAAKYDVRIRRDTWGVPHILGRTDADAAYGLGFAQAEDDFATVQESMFAARGKSALLKGASGVPSDVLFELLNVNPTLDRLYTTDLDAHLRAILDAYAAGVNRYAEMHPEKTAAGFTPLTGRDLAAFTLFRGPTFYGLDGEFAKVARGQVPDVKPVTTAALPSGGETGSNAVAVGPSRSADRHTRLLANSHQPWEGPLTFYEAVVQSREGWHVAGSFFPGSPFLLGGHNEHMGWGATVNHPDLADVYKLEINPANPDQYRLDGAWKTFDKRFVDIAVKGKDGAVTTERREILHAVHGPAIRNAKGVYAIRYPMSGGARQLKQYYAMNRATTLAEWKAAMAIQALPSINYLYGDERGNIGYISNGIYMDKKAGVDWEGVVPGDRSDLIYTKTRPVSQSPQIWNPKSGFLFNSNNTPFRATDGSDDMKPSNYPASMGIQPLSDMTNRAYRAIETFGADPSITAEEFDTYKYDVAYSTRSDEAAWVKEILAADSSKDPDLAAAQKVLSTWDMKADLDSRGTAMVAIIWLQKRQNASLSALQALKLTIPLLKTAYGRVDPKWSEVNRLRRGTLDIPVDGGPDTFRALYGRPDPDGRLHGVNGDCYIIWMDWDPQGRLTSKSIHQYGSATLDASSPHYADQALLFAAHKTKPVWFTEAQLKGNVERDYKPGDPPAK